MATLVNFMVPLGGFFNAFGASRVPWATQLSGLDDIGIGISRNLTAGAMLLAVWMFGAGEARLLSTGAATLFRHRLERLKGPPPQRACAAAN